jgi:hypothetical protein
MHRLPGDGARKWPVAVVAFALLALVVWWLGFREPSPHVVRDYEDCVEQTQAVTSKVQRAALMTRCSARFAGRRKPGGGYTYYDFMQDRSFDIAGPNPTAEERKRIDRAYMDFLDAQRREAVSAELAKRRNEQLQEDLARARQPVGPSTPLALRSPPAAAGPPPAAERRPVEFSAERRPVDPAAERRLADQSKATACEDGSLTCSWAKLSAAVKNAFASSSGTKP